MDKYFGILITEDESSEWKKDKNSKHIKDAVERQKD